jgi:hypothetical protein
MAYSIAAFYDWEAPSMPHAPTPTHLVHLTDQQMSAVLAASHPLPPDRRSDFLADVARELAALPDIGDGAVHRTIMQVQKRHFDPPQFATDNGASKYSRVHRRARSA